MTFVFFRILCRRNGRENSSAVSVAQLRSSPTNFSIPHMPRGDCKEHKCGSEAQSGSSRLSRAVSCPATKYWATKDMALAFNLSE